MSFPSETISNISNLIRLGARAAKARKQRPKEEVVLAEELTSDEKEKKKLERKRKKKFLIKGLPISNFLIHRLPQRPFVIVIVLKTLPKKSLKSKKGKLNPSSRDFEPSSSFWNRQFFCRSQNYHSFTLAAYLVAMHCLNIAFLRNFFIKRMFIALLN